MASYQDARLIIELSKWAMAWGFHEANAWLAAHRQEIRNFDAFSQEYRPGTAEYRHPFTVLGYFENLGLFYRHGVIDADLLLDWLDFGTPWRNLERFALAHRRAEGNERLWTHFELLAKEQEARRTHDHGSGADG